MKMTALAFCHLSRDIKKKIFQAFLGSFVLSPYLFDSTVLSPFFLSPFVLGQFSTNITCCYKQIKSVGGKKTTNESPTKNMGNFHFVVTQSWQAIPHGFTWVLKESSSFSKDVLASSMSTCL